MTYLLDSLLWSAAGLAFSVAACRRLRDWAQQRGLW